MYGRNDPQSLKNANISHSIAFFFQIIIFGNTFFQGFPLAT